MTLACFYPCQTDAWREIAPWDIALPVLAVFVPVMLTLKLVRTFAAKRRFGTTQLNHAQRLELSANHSTVRWLERTATGLAMLFLGLMLQPGLLATS
jgi:hypothetical protein